MTSRRVTAAAALLCAAAAAASAVALTIEEFPLGLLGLAFLAGGWFGLVSGVLHRGVVRFIDFALAAASAGGLVVLVVARGRVVENVVLVLLAAAAVTLARHAFRIHVELPRAAPPRHPVLFYNPRSGGNKAERFDLDGEARERGIEAIGLRPGDDLRDLVEAAVERGADGLAMAGGDGSQAIVAELAARHDLPYACIPAGTRNHFALDLGVDRDDVVGSLDAFTDGGERVVDLAEVNGRVFVNNVSLGLYAEAVQRSGYREAKVRTLLDVLPDALADPGGPSDLRWTGPDDTEHRAAAAVLVSNNAYRLGGPVGSGTRPRIDGGELGVLVVGSRTEGRGRVEGRWTQWSAPTLLIDAAGPVAAGIDGEAATLEPPLRFTSRPGALRVRVAHAHPGASPSAGAPKGFTEGVRALLQIAAGKWNHNDERSTDGQVRG